MVSPPWTAELQQPSPERTEISGAPSLPDCSLHVVRGQKAVLAAAPEIVELTRRTGQYDNPLLCPDFFLGRVRLFPGNEPVVLLVRSRDRLEGAVYLHEKLFCGIHTGYLRGFDHLSGESTVIAREEVRTALLQRAFHQLFATTRVRVAWATVCQAAGEPLQTTPPLRMVRTAVSSIGREHTFKLGETFAQTLEGSFGQNRRRNLRRYRRRAEKELGATFNPDLTLKQSDQALQDLGDRSFQPFSISSAGWKEMDALLRTQSGYFAMGLQVDDGWVSFLVGMRRGKSTYAHLQMNHSEYARYSLSTVLRSHFFEHEIALGQEEIKFVNGTCAAYQGCCETDRCVTVTARRGLAASVLFNWIAPWHSAPDHALNIERWTT